jgi:methionyl aminopeptidase
MLRVLCGSVEKSIRPYGYTVVREFVGHGVGEELHEEPQVPNFDSKEVRKIQLKSGMVLAIEPMVNMGTARVTVLEDDWTVVTNDRAPSAHFEHMVLVTDGDPEVLTSRDRLTAPLAPSLAGGSD